MRIKFFELFFGVAEMKKKKQTNKQTAKLTLKIDSLHGKCGAAIQATPLPSGF